MDTIREIEVRRETILQELRRAQRRAMLTTYLHPARLWPELRTASGWRDLRSKIVAGWRLLRGWD